MQYPRLISVMNSVSIKLLLKPVKYVEGHGIKSMNYSVCVMTPFGFWMLTLMRDMPIVLR